MEDGQTQSGLALYVNMCRQGFHTLVVHTITHVWAVFRPSRHRWPALEDEDVRAKEADGASDAGEEGVHDGDESDVDSGEFERFDFRGGEGGGGGGGAGRDEAAARAAVEEARAAERARRSAAAMEAGTPLLLEAESEDEEDPDDTDEDEEEGEVTDEVGRVIRVGFLAPHIIP